MIQVLNALNIRAFESFSGSPNLTAAVQRQTAGITHYYDTDSLRYFNCRVLRVITDADGIYMATICSQDSNGQGKRAFTYIFHSADGHSFGAEGGHKFFATRKAAEHAMLEFARTIDVRLILKEMVARKFAVAKRRLHEAESGEAALQLFMLENAK